MHAYLVTNRDGDYIEVPSVVPIIEQVNDLLTKADDNTNPHCKHHLSVSECPISNGECVCPNRCGDPGDYRGNDYGDDE